MAEESFWRVIEPASPMGKREDRLYADTVKAWVELRSDKECSGCLVVSFHDDGFFIQYMGNETLDGPQIMERLQWVADQTLKAQPDYRDFGKW